MHSHLFSFEPPIRHLAFIFFRRKITRIAGKTRGFAQFENKCIATKDFSQLPRAAADGVCMQRKAAAKSSKQMGRIHQPSTNEQTENLLKNKSHSKIERNEIINRTEEEVTMKSKAGVSSVLAAVMNPPSTVLVPGRTALAEAVPKLVKFLHVAENDVSVKKALKLVGYGKAAHQLGWKYVRGAGATREADGIEPSDAAKALTFLEGWIGPYFRRAQAVLKYDYPEQESYVFEDLRSARGPEAIAALATFFSRLDDLKATPVGHKALAALASVGITETERKRVSALVEIAETYTPDDEAAQPVDAQMQARLLAHTFFAKWSELARTVITNRTTLISMGIGRRRTRSAASTAPPAPIATPPVVVTPATPAAPAIPQLPAAGQTASTDSYKEHAAE